MRCLSKQSTRPAAAFCRWASLHSRPAPACRVVPSIGDAKPHRIHAVLREATVSDLPGIWRVRYAVQENLLTPGRISDEDVRREIEETGRGWVVVEGGEIRAFGICNGQTGNIWALFVHPNCQGAGYGSLLHDQMLAWLSTRKAPTPWLTTGPNTKARGFYERRGWVLVSAPENEDARFERANAA